MAENQETDLSFLEKKDANALTGKDIFYTILRNLHWIILCAVIGAVIAWFVSDRADRIYESHAKIMINSITRNRLDNGASMLENITNRRVATTMNAINDEIIVLQSETPMLEVAKRLGLGTTYKCQTKLVRRVRDLYSDTPIRVEFPDLKETDYATAVITVQKDSSLTIQIGDFEPVEGRLGDTLSTSFGRIAVHPTWALRELYYDNPITVNHLNINDVANSYRHRVSIARNSTSDGIINFSLKDTSPERAADILNEMITVYNENTIFEKRAIIQQTSDYINERIAQLNSELGAQESQIASFKQNNQLLNLQDYGQAYMAQSIQTSEEMERLQAEISHAQYLLQFTQSNVENKLFPVTINIEDENIKSTIARFNELVLKLDKYKESGTTNNPIVRDMQLEQASLKSNLNQLLTSYIAAISQRMGSAQMANQQAAAKILATRHLRDETDSGEKHFFTTLRPVSSFAGGVMGQTGIETAEVVRAIAAELRPAAIIAVDALACTDISRLGTTIQLTDTGISPGSGVSNRRQELSEKVMGVPVIAVGVPTVVDMHTIVRSLTGKSINGELPNMMVTPRDIDRLTERASQLIAFGINLALQPTLSFEDVRGLF